MRLFDKKVGAEEDTDADLSSIVRIAAIVAPFAFAAYITNKYAIDDAFDVLLNVGDAGFWLDMLP